MFWTPSWRSLTKWPMRRPTHCKYEHFTCLAHHDQCRILNFASHTFPAASSQGGPLMLCIICTYVFHWPTFYSTQCLFVPQSGFYPPPPPSPPPWVDPYNKYVYFLRCVLLFLRWIPGHWTYLICTIPSVTVQMCVLHNYSPERIYSSVFFTQHRTAPVFFNVILMNPQQTFCT